MEDISMIVNSLPAPTWEKLGMNRAKIDGLKISGGCKVKTSAGELTAVESKIPEIKTGMGEEINALLDSANINAFSADSKCIISYEFDGENAQAGRLFIDVKANDEKTVIMDYSSNSESGDGVMQTLVNLEEGAKLTLVQVVRVGKNFRFLNDIGARVLDKSSFKLVQLYLSGDKVYSGCEADLIGEASDFETNLGYNLDDEQILDMNYVAKHIGKKSTSRITASGALAGKSYKIFRGTIDFVNGAKASVGNENEDVLILDDGVINKTIPLILCAEEDVEGNHGATIGKPDEDILFYLASRGIDEKESLRMLKLAKLDVAASHICDDEYRAEILRYIHGDTE